MGEIVALLIIVGGAVWWWITDARADRRAKHFCHRPYKKVTRFLLALALLGVVGCASRVDTRACMEASSTLQFTMEQPINRHDYVNGDFDARYMANALRDVLRYCGELKNK